MSDDRYVDFIVLVPVIKSPDESDPTDEIRYTGEWRYRCCSANGNILTWSQNYESLEGAEDEANKMALQLGGISIRYAEEADDDG